MSLSPDLKQRVLAAVAQAPAPTRAETLRARAWLFACGAAGALGIFFIEGGARLTARPPSLVALTSVGTAVIAGTGAWVLLTRGRSLLGRSGARLLLAALASTALFVVWRYRVAAHYGTVDAWPTRPGVRCLALSIATGAAPLFCALWAARHTVAASPVATGAAFGAGAGLASAALIDLWCPVSFLPHLLFGHVLPIAVLALLGGVLGSRLLRIRWR